MRRWIVGTGLRRLVRTKQSFSSRTVSTAPYIISGTEDLQSRTAVSLHKYGFAVIPKFYQEEELSKLSDKFISRTVKTISDLKAHHTLEVGSENGFHEVCLRSPGRYDVSSTFEEFDTEHLEPVEKLICPILGEDAEQAFCGVVYSEPGSLDQKWHADSLHLYDTHAPPNLINGLIALHDVPLIMGPTEFSPASHLVTNHLSNDQVDGINIVYQTTPDNNLPQLIGSDSSADFCTALEAGTLVLFDDRTLHRGRANESGDSRYVGYFSYKRPWFAATTHFEATRSLYPLPTATPCIASTVRDQFPSISTDYPSSIFADGAGGSQVPQTVIDAVGSHMRHGSANLGGYYPTSELCLQVTRAARAASADLLNCAPSEITFGSNMTTVTYHLAHSLFQNIGPGDNILVSALEHNANNSIWQTVARTKGCEVRTIPLLPAECQLDLDSMTHLIDENTKFVAVGAASNSLGTINDIKRVCAAAREVGAYSFIDAVHYAPHDVIDVKQIGCDFLVCSSYKFYGPHHAVLYGRETVMDDDSSFRPFKIDTAANLLPSDESYQLSKWELGTANFEALAGIEACINYIASVGKSTSDSRRQRITASWDAIREHEMELKRTFLHGAKDIPNLSVFGITDETRMDQRTSTFAIGVSGRSMDDLTQQLCKQGIFCTSGNHYCTFWEKYLEMDDIDGAARLGFLHYNTKDEVERVLETLEHLAKAQ